MSFIARPRLRPARALAAGAIVLALTALGASPAAAQRRGQSQGSATQVTPRSIESSEARNAAKRFDHMASLDDVLAGVPGLARAQKDSLGRIEKTYHAHLRGYSAAAKKLFGEDGSRAPDLNAMRRLEEGARGLRADELAAARGVLTTDAQRTRFDANVAALPSSDAPHTP